MASNEEMLYRVANKFSIISSEMVGLRRFGNDVINYLDSNGITATILPINPKLMPKKGLDKFTNMFSVTLKNGIESLRFARMLQDFYSDKDIKLVVLPVI